jgi:hypothetical protein
MTGQRVKKTHDIVAHKGFAASDAKLSRAPRNKSGDQAIELLQTQQIAPRQKRHML